MANTDNGYTQFPNVLYDALLSQRLSITQERALLYVIRKTYGFHKDDDYISISKMAKETGFTRRAMINAVHDLEKMGILHCGKVVSGRPTSMQILDPKKWDMECSNL